MTVLTRQRQDLIDDDLKIPYRILGSKDQGYFQLDEWVTLHRTNGDGEALVYLDGRYYLLESIDLEFKQTGEQS